MFKAKSISLLTLVVLAFNPGIALPEQHQANEQTAYAGDITGRWLDDMDVTDFKQDGNKVTAEIGVNGSRLSGTRDGDLITFSFNYRLTDRGTGRKGVGELRISSDGTRLTGTRSGGGFRKDSEWILVKEIDKQ